MRDGSKEPALTGSFPFLHDRAMEAFANGALAQAESFCQRAILLDPSHAGIHNLLGQVNLALKRPAEALAAFSIAVRLSPQRPNLLFNQALAYQALGQLELAVASLTTAIGLSPSEAILHSKLGQLLMASGANDEAIGVLRHALELDSGSAPARINLAQALLDLGDAVEAETLARAVVSMAPKDANAYRLLGRVQQTKGEFAEAIKSFEASISLQPNQAASYFALVYSKRMSADDRRLIGQMESIVSARPIPDADRVLLEYAVGKSLDDLGEYRSAIGHFDEANRLSLVLAEAAGRRFDSELETRRVERVIELFPPELFESQPSAGDRPIFVVGMIRSGTTLVEQILSRHPSICAGGELPYWVENEPRLLVEVVSGKFDPAAWRREYDAVLDRASSVVPHVTDKMPLNYRTLGLIHLAYPDAKIVHCRRNPLDTCLSIYLTPYRHAPEFAHDRQNIVAAYQEYQRLMAHWRSAIPGDRLIEVDYEELVEAPEPSVRRLVQFLGLDWHDDLLSLGGDERPVHTPSQWQVRQSIYRRSAGRWKNYADFLGPIRSLSE